MNNEEYDKYRELLITGLNAYFEFPGKITKPYMNLFADLEKEGKFQEIRSTHNQAIEICTELKNLLMNNQNSFWDEQIIQTIRKKTKNIDYLLQQLINLIKPNLREYQVLLPHLAMNSSLIEDTSKLTNLTLNRLEEFARQKKNVKKSIFQRIFG
jgi:hypothetical protein